MPDFWLWDDDDGANDPRTRVPWFDTPIGKLIGAQSSSGVQHIARELLGHGSFAVGFHVGFVSTHFRSDFPDLLRMIVLDEIYELLFGRVSSGLQHSLFYRRTFGLLAREIDRNSFVFHELEDAHRHAHALFAEVADVLRHPGDFPAGLPAQVAREYEDKWKRLAELNARPALSDRFEAGRAAGELYAELIATIAGLLALGAMTAELAAHGRQLVRLAGRLSAGRRNGVLPSTSQPRLRASDPEPAPRTRAPEPPSERLPVRRVALQGVTQQELDLAAAPTPLRATAAEEAARVAAREKVAMRFYEQYGGVSPAKSPREVAAIDLTQPVRVGPPPYLTEPQWQWRVPGRDTGKYFAGEVNEPTRLGIHHSGNTAKGLPPQRRVLEAYRVPEDAPYLESTSRPVIDSWSVTSESHATQGGAVQRYIPSATKAPKVEVP